MKAKKELTKKRHFSEVTTPSRKRQVVIVKARSNGFRSHEKSVKLPKTAQKTAKKCQNTIKPSKSAAKEFIKKPIAKIPTNR